MKKIIDLINFIASLITVEEFVRKVLSIFYTACLKAYIFKEKKFFFNKIKTNKPLLKYFKIQKNIIIEI
ncbi:hypothetical protein [Clostridium weizhouense]|uniref:Uncharacterized protein n=1 Tax=Clostridium weizhouense TaxID=2859781 RepID=A0ABS7AKN6_9CLOT|nr:hypothetical protein [Clostridium weizhouense]MBW6408986.1 hypothetical protein [Clostridium weizhouense]